MRLIGNPLIWLRRIKHRCGYGVHSPYAFDFLTQVVYERAHYYAYAELDELLDPMVVLLSLRPRKVNRLFMRLANYQMPKNALFIAENLVSLAAIKAGARFVKLGSEPTRKRDCDFALIDAPVSDIVESMATDSMLVIDNLHRCRPFWQQVCADQRVTLTFDLYDVGIAMVELPLNKQHYVVNF